MAILLNTISLFKRIRFVLLLFCWVIFIQAAYPQIKLNITANSINTDSIAICSGDPIQLHVQGEYWMINESFGTGAPGPGWSFITPNVTYQPYCDTANPTNCLWFGPLAVPDRILETQDLDFTLGGLISFDLRFAMQNGPVGCEGPDEMLEGVSLQYSLDQGAIWTNITYFCPNGTFLPANPWVQSPLTMFPTQFTSWANYNFVIPVAAMTTHTRLRWIQESTSFFNGHYDDNWGMDNIRISRSILQEIVWGDGNTSATPPPVFPQQTTTYYVYVINYLDPSDTLAMDSLIVIVYPDPFVVISGDSAICIGETSILAASGSYDFLWNTGVSGPYLVDSPTVSTSYHVTATNDFGCSSAEQKNIIVFPHPVVTVQGDSVCPGDTAILQVGGGISYVWSNRFTGSSLVVKAVNTSIYGVTITDINGCSDTASVLLKVFSLPDVVISQDTVICYGDVAHLFAGGGSFYHWSNSAVKQDIFVDPLNETVYQVTVTDANGCSNTGEIRVSVNPFHELFLSASRDTVCRGSSVTLLASGGSAYEWNNGRTEPEITVYPDYTSVYEATASEEYLGTWCQVVSKMEIQVKECENFYFPNAILPKGYNPIFKPIGEYQQINRYVLVIYDRWGRKIFESKDPSFGWDGTVKGEYVQMGTYIYRVQFNKTLNGDPYDKTGTVTVLY